MGEFSVLEDTTRKTHRKFILVDTIEFNSKMNSNEVDSYFIDPIAIIISTSGNVRFSKLPNLNITDKYPSIAEEFKTSVIDYQNNAGLAQ